MSENKITKTDKHQVGLTLPEKVYMSHGEKSMLLDMPHAQKLVKYESKKGLDNWVPSDKNKQKMKIENGAIVLD